MATLVASPVLQPRPHRWTQDEYHQICALPAFADRRIQLIDGEIIEMPGPGNPHCISMECVTEILRGVFGPGHWVRMQMPLDLGTYSEPQPDCAVVVGTPRSYSAHPTTALLVVEVSDSSLDYDRDDKASLYAAAGIGDYWIVNLVDRQLEVHRRPVTDAGALLGHRYADRTVLGPADSVAPLAAPQAALRVADLLP